MCVLSRSVLVDSASRWAAARQASLSFAISRSFLKLMSIESVMPSNHLILCQLLLLLPSIFLSIRVFSSGLALHIRQPKDWGFSFSPSNEYSGLIFFRIDWFDLLAIQGTSRVFSSSTIRKHLRRSAFFLVQEIFLTQGLNPYLLHLLHWQADSLLLHLGSLKGTIFTSRKLAKSTNEGSLFSARTLLSWFNRSPLSLIPPLRNFPSTDALTLL